jgi:MOSC domain-containing protein YiiM
VENISGEMNKLEGRVVAVFKSKVRGETKLKVDRIQLKEDFGVEGDVHAGKTHRQVSLLGEESIKKNNRIRKLNRNNFAQNITSTALRLYELSIGTKLKIGDKALLEITEIGKEGEIDPDNIMISEGIFTKVLKGGIVKEGDKILVVEY